MIWTHVWTGACWAWRWLTPVQWAALPHISKYWLLGKTPHLVVGALGLVCAGSGVGLMWLPPIFSPIPLISRAPLISASPELVSVPEPGSIMVFGVGLSALLILRVARNRHGAAVQRL